MKLEWFGTAAILVWEGDTVIAFDPFGGIDWRSTQPETCPEGCAEYFIKASDVFVTHGHFDHILQIPAVYQSANAKIHATQTPCDTLRRNGFPEDRIAKIVPGQNCTVGNLSVTAYQGRHCEFDKALVLKTALRYLKPVNLHRGLRLLGLNRRYTENGEILFYEVSCRKRKLQIMGSMGLDSHEAYPTGADLLILPYQGKSDPVNYAASLVERLKPKAVLLDHYDDSFPPMTAQVDTSGIEAMLKEKYNIPCRAMRRGIAYEMEELTL